MTKRPREKSCGRFFNVPAALRKGCISAELHLLYLVVDILPDCAYNTIYSGFKRGKVSIFPRRLFRMPETGENRKIFAGFLFYLFGFSGGEFA